MLRCSVRRSRYIVPATASTRWSTIAANLVRGRKGVNFRARKADERHNSACCAQSSWRKGETRHFIMRAGWLCSCGERQAAAAGGQGDDGAGDAWPFASTTRPFASDGRPFASDGRPFASDSWPFASATFTRLLRLLGFMATRMRKD